MNCDYCDGDRDGFVTRLPKRDVGFNAYVLKNGVLEPHLEITGAYKRVRFNINYCPMCGKKLKGE